MFHRLCVRQRHDHVRCVWIKVGGGGGVLRGVEGGGCVGYKNKPCDG